MVAVNLPLEKVQLIGEKLALVLNGIFTSPVTSKLAFVFIENAGCDGFVTAPFCVTVRRVPPSVPSAFDATILNEPTIPLLAP